jgi:hypothetical protein
LLLPFNYVVAMDMPIEPVANFDQFTTNVQEGSETTSVKVNFSKSFSGTLRYTVSGTALSISRYEGNIAVNGKSVDIPVTITEDEEVQVTLRTIVLNIYYLEEERLRLGYVPGSSTEHTIYIHDNDAIWSGTLEINYTAVNFQMKIIQGSTSTFGALFTDGYGIIPKNGEDEEWPAASISLSETLFDATVQGITIPSNSILANVDMERKFVFHADSQAPGHSVDPESHIRGTLTEYLVSTSSPQFNRTILGTFTLIKQIANVDEQLTQVKFEDKN